MHLLVLRVQLKDGGCFVVVPTGHATFAGNVRICIDHNSM